MRFNPNLKRRLLGFASVIIGIVMILSQLMSLFFIDYFAGDCTPRAIRFGLIIFYALLIIGGVLLILNQLIARKILLISGLGLLFISLLIFLIDFNCGFVMLFYIDLILGILITLLSRNNRIGLSDKMSSR
jgi:hypothetical protein